MRNFLRIVFNVERLKDKWYRMAGIPIVALLANVIFYYDMNEKHGFSFISDYLYTVLFAFFIWEADRQVIIYTRRKFPGHQQSKKRILWMILGAAGATTIIMTAISAFFDLTDYWGYDYTAKNYFYNIFVALTYTIIIAGSYEAIFYFQRWRNVAVEAEMLKRENLQSQLESLKQQVNPHFLFNSLNTLSSLMRKDVDRAEMFLDELSKVYRYLLRNNEGELIDLSTELQFIQSFFHLLKTRYGEALQLKINIRESDKDLLLPPLTLQLLVENAVKHNIIDKARPLCVELETNGDQLSVRNNLQKKHLKPPSSKIGLSNITAKYRLLGQPGISIVETSESFIVTIPLIKKG